jgi:hypothetical protein
MAEGGFLASIDNIPPLLFRFQFNPEILSDKKSFKYNPVAIGNPAFDKTSAAKGFFDTIGGLVDDVKEFAAFLIQVKPLETVEGEPRVYTIDFVLDGSVPDPGSTTLRHPDMSIEPDLSVLRAFMYPSMDLITFGKGLFSQEARNCFHWKETPDCTLAVGPISVKCKMTDLNIKITSFNEDMTPRRAEVNATLKEQSKAFHPLLEFIKRDISIGESYVREGSFTLLKDISESTIPKFIRDLF